MSEEMNKPRSRPWAKVVERILEFSAEAQIERRQTDPHSSAFHNLTGAIAAYGQMLGVLSKLQHLQEENSSIIDRYDLTGCVRAMTNPSQA